MNPRPPFLHVLQALRWRRFVARRGLTAPLASRPLVERVRVSPGQGQDVRLGEPAALCLRIDRLLEELDEAERTLLWADDPRSVGLPDRRTMYDRQYKLRRRLAPRFAQEGLVPKPEDRLVLEV